MIRGRWAGISKCHLTTNEGGGGDSIQFDAERKRERVNSADSALIVAFHLGQMVVASVGFAVAALYPLSSFHMHTEMVV